MGEEIFDIDPAEKDRGRYAALEARKSPYREITYLCRVLGCGPKTIGRGLAALDALEDTSSGGRIRKIGGGRKRALVMIEGIDEIFLMVSEHYTAGDPMQEQERVCWTNEPDVSGHNRAYECRRDYQGALAVEALISRLMDCLAQII